MTYKKLLDLKTFLIELFSNPKIREDVPGSASVSIDPSVFSIGQHMANNEGEEDLIEVEEVDSLIICSKMTGFKTVLVMVVSVGIIAKEVGMVFLETEDKVKEILEVTCMVKVEDEVGSTKVQVLDAQE